MNVGDVITWKRTFTDDHIRQFQRLSGDEGIHHIQTDDQGWLMARSSSPPSAHNDRRRSQFCRSRNDVQHSSSVFADDTIKSNITITDHEDRGIMNESSKWTCLNQRGKEVMKGAAAGFVRP